jgi:hypothetical protein
VSQIVKAWGLRVTLREVGQQQTVATHPTDRKKKKRRRRNMSEKRESEGTRSTKNELGPNRDRFASCTVALFESFLNQSVFQRGLMKDQRNLSVVNTCRVQHFVTRSVNRKKNKGNYNRRGEHKSEGK